MAYVLIETEELELTLRKLLREELQNLSQEDEIGGIELAEKVTGLKSATIYKKVSSREIPFRQEIKKGKIQFSRKDLVKWMDDKRKKTRTEMRQFLALK